MSANFTIKPVTKGIYGHIQVVVGLEPDAPIKVYSPLIVDAERFDDGYICLKEM